MRRLLLGDETATLTPEQAFLLLGSPAPRFLGPRFFEGHGIPLIGHRSKVLRWHPHLDEEAMTLSQDVELKLDWPGGGPLVEKMRVLRSDTRTGYRPRELRFRDLDRRERRVEVHPESWFWILLGSCSQIAVSYPWRETEIPWFVLTGLPPAVEPIFAKTEVMYSEEEAEPTLATITLRVFPFVSEGSVLSAYRLERLLLLGTRPARPVPLPNLWLFDFVEERLQGSEIPPGWAALLEEWNREMPKWRKSDRSQFRRDYMRTRELLVEPHLRETL